MTDRSVLLGTCGVLAIGVDSGLQKRPRTVDAAGGMSPGGKS